MRRVYTLSVEKGSMSKVFLGIIAAASVLNLILLAMLLYARFQLAGVAADAATLISATESQPLAPFTTNVSINQTVSVPIDASIPVSTIVHVPVVIPILGQQVNVTVPINTNVPVKTTVSVPIRASVPVRVTLGDTPFGSMLQSLHDILTQLANPWGF